MIQEILKVYVLLIILRLCKILFGRHAQVGSCIEVGDYNVKNCSGTPLQEAVGSYVSPRLSRYCYMSQTPYNLRCSVSCLPIYPAPLGPIHQCLYNLWL